MTLFVDGKVKEKMEVEKRIFNGGKDAMYYLPTLVFPLQKAGSFKSKISNLKVYNYCIGNTEK